MTGRTCHVVFVGEVDHGKSTLLGRLLVDAGALAHRLDGIEPDYAYVLDGFREEREDSFTLDTVRAVLDVGETRFALIDVPGHAALLKNMATGASRADAAVVVVDVVEEVREQTLRHLEVLELLGIDRCVVAVSKMDVAGYAAAAFDAVAARTAAAAAAHGMAVVARVPVGARTGANVTTPSPEMRWYDGPPLLGAIELLARRPEAARPVRFTVQDVYAHGGAPLVVGRVESGRLVAGQAVVGCPGGSRATVASIERWGEPDAVTAAEGESVGLRVTGEPPAPGTVLAAEAQPVPASRRWLARFLVTGERSLEDGARYALRHRNVSVGCRVATVAAPGDPASPGPRAGDIARIVLDFDENVAGEPFRTCEPLGRFMLCDPAGQAVGLGVVEAVEAPA